MQLPADIGDLYRLYGPSVYRRALQLLAQPQDAEEATHDVFAALMEQPKQFEGRSSMTTYLYSTTTHLCLNRLRNGRTRAVRLRAAFPEAANASQAARAERIAMLRELLGEMPAELAEVAVYFYIDEMTHAEIAAQLGCARRTVGDLLERARAYASREA
jgi:RNA polymerase sigma factor (sigma-70 family)